MLFFTWPKPTFRQAFCFLKEKSECFLKGWWWCILRPRLWRKRDLTGGISTRRLIWKSFYLFNRKFLGHVMYLYNTVRDTFLQMTVSCFLQTTDSNFLKSLYDFPARPWEIFRIRHDPAATYDSLEVNSRKKTAIWRLYIVLTLLEGP